jgi:hypothetical protein
MVLDFRDHPEAMRRWHATELFHRARALNAAMETLCATRVFDGDPELVDTAPCELSYAHQGGDPA